MLFPCPHHAACTLCFAWAAPPQPATPCCCPSTCAKAALPSCSSLLRTRDHDRNHHVAKNCPCNVPTDANTQIISNTSRPQPYGSDRNALFPCTLAAPYLAQQLPLECAGHIAVQAPVGCAQQVLVKPALRLHTPGITQRGGVASGERVPGMPSFNASCCPGWHLQYMPMAQPTASTPRNPMARITAPGPSAGLIQDTCHGLVPSVQSAMNFTLPGLPSFPAGTDSLHASHKVCPLSQQLPAYCRFIVLKVPKT